MKKLIVILSLISFSCTDKALLVEQKVLFSQLIEPSENVYIELLSYYPAKNRNESNLYIVKDIYSNDTLYVIDKDILPVADFVKNYNGMENTAIILQKGLMKNKDSYTVSIPSNYNLNHKKVFLGQLIRLID